MSKRKLITILSCALLLIGAIVGNSTIANACFINDHLIVQNQVLLSEPNLNNLAVIINTNKNPLVLYSAANVRSSITSYISVGEMLNYQATNNPNFYKVIVQETGATGYITADNLQIIESGLNKVYTNINKGGQIINVATDVKLMSSPNVHAQILGNYKNNTPMGVLGKQDQWYKVSIGEQTGYIYQSYVGIDSYQYKNINTVGVTSSTRQTQINKTISNTQTASIKAVPIISGKNNNTSLTGASSIIRLVNKNMHIFIPDDEAIYMTKTVLGNFSYTIPKGAHEIYIINKNSYNNMSYIRYGKNYGYVSTKLLKVVENDYININVFKNK